MYQVAAEFAGDLARDGQAQAQSPLLARRERREQLVGDLMRDARAGIGDRQRHHVGLPFRRHADRPARVDGVLDQVDQHLLQSHAVSRQLHVAHRGIDRHLQHTACAFADQHHRAVEDRSQRRRAARARSPACEAAQFGGDGTDAIGERDDVMKVVARGFGPAAVQQRRPVLREGPDRGDRLVDLVSDAGSDLAERAETVRLRQFLARGSVASIRQRAFFGLGAQTGVGIA